MVISLSVSYFFPEVSVGDGRNEGEKRKEKKGKEKKRIKTNIGGGGGVDTLGSLYCFYTPLYCSTYRF